MLSYLHRVFVALDIALNVLLGGLEDETISARVRRVSDAHPHFSWQPGVLIAKGLNAALNWIQPNHGAHAEAGDLARAETVETTEDAALHLPPDTP